MIKKKEIGSIVGYVDQKLCRDFIRNAQLRNEARAILLVCAESDQRVWDIIEQEFPLNIDKFTYQVNNQTGALIISGFKNTKVSSNSITKKRG